MPVQLKDDPSNCVYLQCCVNQERPVLMIASAMINFVLELRPRSLLNDYFLPVSGNRAIAEKGPLSVKIAINAFKRHENSNTEVNV